jgi:hypothetical protein
MKHEANIDLSITQIRRRLPRLQPMEPHKQPRIRPNLGSRHNHILLLHGRRHDISRYRVVPASPSQHGELQRRHEWSKSSKKISTVHVLGEVSGRFSDDGSQQCCCYAEVEEVEEAEDFGLDEGVEK